MVARVLFVLTRQFAATPGLDRLDTVLGARHFAGSLISNAVTALGTAVALLFLVLLLRVVLRRNWAVVTVFLLLCVAGTDQPGVRCWVWSWVSSSAARFCWRPKDRAFLRLL